MSQEDEEGIETTTVQLPTGSRDKLKEEKKDGENYGEAFDRIIHNHKYYKQIKKIVLQEAADSVEV